MVRPGWGRIRRGTIVGLLACTALSGTAHAQQWNGSVSNDWFDPRNWTPNQVPAGNGSVTIDVPTSGPVLIDRNETMTLGELQIGPNNAGALTVRGGTKLTVNGQSGIGGGQITGTAGNGTLLVSGTGTEVSLGAQLYVAPRVNARGTLTVTDGAVLRTNDSAIFGTAAGSVARVSIAGAGSTIQARGALYLGKVNDAPGTYDARLTITDGGKYLGGDSVTNVIGLGGSVLVSGTGSLMSIDTALDISGDLRIENGGEASFETIGVDGGGTIDVAGATLRAGAVNHSGGFSIHDTARVTATDSRIEVGSLLGMSGSASLTLVNSAFQSNSVRMLGNAVLNIGGADGAAPGAPGTFATGGVTLEQAGTRLVFNHNGTLDFGGFINGPGSVLHRAGVTRLTSTESASLSGLFDHSGGTVVLNGAFRGDELRVSGGATIAGTGGLLSGRLNVLDGIVAPGDGGIGTLQLSALSLSSASVLNFQLGAPNQAGGAGSDFINVNTSDGTGNLVLDGTLNVTDAGGFGPGLYGLIGYRGSLTDNGLLMGTVPAGFAASDLTIQTSVARQVNLLVAAPVELLSFWDGSGSPRDGTVTGGTGSWTATATNWTNADGSRSGLYDPSALLIFAGTGGVVTVDNGAGAIATGGGMQFAVDGYRLSGGAIGLANQTPTIRVGDGTTAGAGFTATIASDIGNATGFTKTDLGTLALTGRTALSGAFEAQGGTLAVQNGGALSAASMLVGQGATLRVGGTGTTFALIGAARSDVSGNMVVTDGAVATMTPARIATGGSLTVTGGAQVNAPAAAQGWVIDQGADLLIAGAGTRFTTGNDLNIASSLSGQPAGSAIITDGAVVEVNVANTSALAFGVPRTLTVSNGARLSFAGGGLLLNSGTLDVRGATVEMHQDLVMGSIHGNNILTLIDANFRAPSIGGSGSALGTVINLGGVAGGPAGRIGTFDVGSLQLAATDAQLILNHSDTGFDLTSAIGGIGTIRHLAGDTRLSGTSTDFASTLALSGGHVRVDGQFGGSEARVVVGGNATLSGSGRIGGSVSVGAGTIAAGGQPVAGVEQTTALNAVVSPNDVVGLLTIDGSLALTGESFLRYQLGAPDGMAGRSSDLLNVGGDLTLDGTLDVIDAGGFGAGLYRLVNYGGALTDNGLAIGLTPEGYDAADLTVQTATAGQVNLLVTAPVSSFDLWDGTGAAGDGTVAGGSGSWASTATNWTIANGTRNGAYDPATLLIFAGAAGTVTVDNAAGQVTLRNGAQFATDGYNVTGGTVRLDAADTVFRVGDGTTAGAGYGTTISSALTGSGGLLKTDLGTLILTGANSYSGGTTVRSGTLRAASGSLAGGVAVEGGGTLQIDQATDGRYAAAVSGTGSIRKTGIGTLSLTGTSPGFMGTMRVETGSLDVTGTLGGTTVVAAGAALTGSGRLGSVDVAGRIAPGGGTATLRLDGDLILRAGSTYAVDLTAAGGTDLLSVAGTARIEGGTVAVTTLDPETDYRDGATYRILDATGGSSGTFASLTETSAFLDFALQYDPSGAAIRVSQVRTFPDVAKTFNQRQAATALKSLNRAPGSDSLAVHNTILMLDQEAALDAFDAGSGEIYAALIGGGQRRTMHRAQGMMMRGNATLAEGIDIWGGLTGNNGHVDADGNGGRFGQRQGGGEMGVDYRADGFSFGVSGGIQRGDLDLPSRRSHAEMRDWTVGAYGRLERATGLSVVAGILRARSEATVARTIGIDAPARIARSEVALDSTAISGSVGYAWKSGSWSLGPVTSVHYAVGRLGRFAENGAGALNLSAGRNSDHWVRYGLGGVARWRTDQGHADLSMRYVTGPRNDADARLLMAGSPVPFEVRAAQGARKGVSLQASGTQALGSGWSLSGQAAAFAASSENSVAGFVRLSKIF